MNVSEKKYSVSDLVKAFMAGSLLRNDEYQRGEVWSTLQKATFIDSVFRGYPVPALFFHRVETPGLDDVPAVKYEIIDGQQRLTALRDFDAGTFPLLKMTGEPQLRLPKGVRALPAPWAGKTFNELDDQLRADYHAREITVFVVASDAHPDEVRDLFIRLQSGTALTRQQVRDAWPGNVGPFIERLAGKLKTRPTLKLFAIIDKRGLRADEELKDSHVFDRQMCAQFLKVFLARATDPYAYPSVSANQLDMMYHEYTDFDPKSELAQRFKTVLESVADVFERVKRRVAKAKFRRIDVTAVMMYFQDASRDPQFKLGPTTVEAVARSIVDGVEADLEGPTGKSTSASTLKNHYDWWRENVCKAAGVRLDPKRLFDEDDKRRIRGRDGGVCQVCTTEIGADPEEFDHFPVPHRDGGRTIPENGRLVHRRCHPRGRPVEDT